MQKDYGYDIGASQIRRFYCNKHGFKQATFRKHGKAHRGLIHEDGTLTASCSCPGAKNGRLASGAFIIANDGWELSNCGN
jgi:hypothetical protein